MRFIHVYLLGYFILVIGAALALWQAGVLARIPSLYLLMAGVIVVGLGLLLAATSVRRTT